MVVASFALAASSRLVCAEDSALGLSEVLSRTLDRSPNVRRAAAQALQREGARREASGTFDYTFEAEPSFKIEENELDSDRRSTEETRRERRFFSALGFRQLIEGTQRDSARRQLRIPPCPAAFNSIRVDARLFFDPRDPRFRDLPDDEPLPDAFALLCVPAAFGISTLDQLTSTIEELLLRPGVDNDIELDRLLSQILFVGSDDLIEDVRQRGIEELERFLRLAIDAEQLEILRFLRLGPVPRDEILKVVGLGVGVSRPLRTGGVLRLRYEYRGTERNYRDKPLDADFGAITRNSFETAVLFGATQPLGKGGGRTSAAAAEKAAEAKARAASLQLRHEIARTTLECIEAYLDVAAARESVTLLESVLEGYGRIRGALSQLVQARDRARSEITRVDARIGDVEAALTSARVRLVSSRSALAKVMGSTVDAIGPINDDQTASLPRTVDAAAARADVLARRNDVIASRLLVDASGALSAASRADLSHKLDLSVQAGMHTRYFGPYFRVLPDEHPDDPKESPIEYFSPKGLWRSLKARWLPEISIKLTFEVPFKNRAAKGRLMQAEGSLQQAKTRARDLERVVEQRVDAAIESQRRAGDELLRRVEAVEHYESSWRAAQELQRMGQLGIIDALLTETDRTQAALQLVQAKREHGAAVARLRFESGTLVSFGAAGRPTGFDLRGIVDDRPAPRAEGVAPIIAPAPAGFE